MWWPWKGPGRDEGRLKKSRDTQQDELADEDEHAVTSVPQWRRTKQIHTTDVYISENIKTVHPKSTMNIKNNEATSPSSGACWLDILTQNSGIGWQSTKDHDDVNKSVTGTSYKRIYCNFCQVVHHQVTTQFFPNNCTQLLQDDTIWNANIPLNMSRTSILPCESTGADKKTYQFKHNLASKSSL